MTRQRGRASAASLEVVRVDGSPNPIQPPADLPADLRQAFVELVASAGVKHFRPADVSLIARFLEADAMAKRAATELRQNPVINGKPSPWLRVSEVANKTVVALAAKLRIGPSARLSQKAVTRMKLPSNALWDDTDGDDAA